MEQIKIAKVDNVSLIFQGHPAPGTLHVTPHHLIFSHAPQPKKKPVPDATTVAPQQQARQKPNPMTPEVWITYPIIASVERRHIGGFGGQADDQTSGDVTPRRQSQPALAIRIRCKDFTFVTFCFEKEKEAKDVFDSIRGLSCCGSIEKLYAFFYKPQKPEKAITGSWNIYDPVKEFERQGMSKDWRMSKINENYTFCDTYPSKLFVPSIISDTTLNYAAKHRSRNRIPVLTYFHNINGCTITRSSQPLTGVRQNRSVQDEKLVLAIFESSHASKTRVGASSSSITLVPTEEEMSLPYNLNLPRNVYGAQQTNLIIDARPTINAMAQHAAGAGSENMENYPFAKKQYLGIDNIHVMRDSLSRVIEAIKDSDLTPFPANRDLLAKSHWLKHIGGLLEGTNVITRQVGLEHSSVLIHCSDGWDRTSQLSALSQICLDPYFRTLEGFMTLVEKDWVSFGFKFVDRCGFLSSEKFFTDAKPTDSEPRPPGVSGIEQAFGAAKLFWDRNKPGAASPGDVDAADETEPTLLDSTTPKRGKTSKTPVPSGANVKETSPIFHQFLDATYQLLLQNPKRFEFNERFLRRLLFHLYSCQYGTFLFNTERERKEARIHSRTRSVWDYFIARREMWLNPDFEGALDSDERGMFGRLIFPDGKQVKWWWEAFGRTHDEMNGRKTTIFDARETRREEPTVVEEDAAGVFKPDGDESANNNAAGEGSAVLGTEASSKLAEAAAADEEEQSIPSIKVVNTPVEPEKVQSPLPPLVALQPAELEDAMPRDQDQDPLGGHMAVDMDLSVSSRARSAASRSRSRGGSTNSNPGSTPSSSSGAKQDTNSAESAEKEEKVEKVERKFEQMELME